MGISAAFPERIPHLIQARAFLFSSRYEVHKVWADKARITLEPFTDFFFLIESLKKNKSGSLESLTGFEGSEQINKPETSQQISWTWFWNSLFYSTDF